MAKNKNIKRANTEVEFTPEQVAELVKCSQDPIYFIERYCKVQHPSKGAIPLVLYPYQKKMVKAFHRNRFCQVLSARQTGKSTVAAGYILWYSIFNDDKTILIASNKNSNAQEILHRIKYMYEELAVDGQSPQSAMFLKPGVQDDGWNKHSVGWDNKSRIISSATTENTGRGLSISLVFIDELAFISPSVQTEFWTSISPTLATGGSAIIASTPNGSVDLFAQMWRTALIEEAEYKKSKSRHPRLHFYPIHVKWTEPPGRGERFKKAEISKIGELKWKQEYECVTGDTLVTLRNEHGIITTIPIEQAYRMVEYYDEIRIN